MATEIFLSCQGSRSIDFGQSSNTQTSIKIDVDNKLFFWDYDLPETKSCFTPMQEPLDKWILHAQCSAVSVSDLKYGFDIRNSLREVHGWIDRISGELSAVGRAASGPPPAELVGQRCRA
jgi:hypothetical protein